MALSSIYLFFLFLDTYKFGSVSATTVVHFFADNGCQDASFTVRTDNQAHDGPCGYLNGINGSSTGYIDPGCGGMEPLHSFI